MGAVGDEGGFEGEAGGDAVAVGFDAVLQGDLGGGERGEIGAGATGEGLRVAAEALAEADVSANVHPLGVVVRLLCHCWRHQEILGQWR